MESTTTSDVFSLSDQTLSDRLEFVEEIGFGNWGSVWLCRPKTNGTGHGQKIAVKLVHRSKTSTTAARVRSLWNEMKIVRSFKDDPHPSIIPFHSFIITPSYALITMSYLPTLIPVEVEESKAREWFRFLLSGVEFLHKRGVVHNDIKPANILVSHKNIPVLVDFGFAEKYDLASDTAFHSNLSYGTPEYLAPERARGLPHDTRKSDIWSLGVTFFEILSGRTPFEHSDGEQFNTSDDLERYWARTLRGKWVGEWSFSSGAEKLLQRMLSPNADLRCTAMQAMADSYWQSPRKDAAAITNKVHKRASSCTSSIIFEKDMDKLLNMTPTSIRNNKENMASPPPGLDVFNSNNTSDSSIRRPLAKSKSQPKVAGASKVHPRKRALAPALGLSPIKASPNASPSGANTSNTSSNGGKENILAFNRLANVVKKDKERDVLNNPSLRNKANNKENNKENARKSIVQETGLGTRRPFGAVNGNVISGNGVMNANAMVKKAEGKVKGGAGKENSAATTATAAAKKGKESTSARDRVKDWERERERLREMQKMEEMEKERDVLYAAAKKALLHEGEQEKEEASRVVEEAVTMNTTTEDPLASSTPHHVEVSALSYPTENEDEGVLVELPPRVPPKRPSAAARIKPISVLDSSRLAEWDARERENVTTYKTSPILPMPHIPAPLTSDVFNFSIDTPPPPVSGSHNHGGRRGSVSKVIRHGIKASIDKTIQMMGISSGRSTPARETSFDVMRPFNFSGINGQHGDASEVVSPTSPLPTVKNSAEHDRIAADARMDRMTIWMKNVEKVVADARQNFAAAATSMSSSTNKELPLPPLPVPLSRNHSRNSRLPRRVIAASQIFQQQQDENGVVSPLFDTSMTSGYSMMNTSMNTSASGAGMRAKSQSTAATSEACGNEAQGTNQDDGLTPRKPVAATSDRAFVSRLPVPIPEVHTPSRQRRATVSTRSPEPGDKEKHRMSIVDVAAAARRDMDVVGGSVDYQGSPSKRREKSKSHANLLQMPIVPVAQLHAELDRDRRPRTESQSPPPRLSEVLDRSLFIAPPLVSRDNLLDFDDDDSNNANDLHHRGARSPTSPSSYNNLRVDTSLANANAATTAANRSRSYSYLSEHTPEHHQKLSTGSNDLLASPYVVEAYPPKTKSKYSISRHRAGSSTAPNDTSTVANTTANSSSLLPPIPDTPSRHRIEGVYDRFLMATTGVKRLGKGYQSEFASLPSGREGHNGSNNGGGPNVLKKGINPFSSGRKFVMHPPVSSEDVIVRRAAVSVDELGMVSMDGGNNAGGVDGPLRERKSEERERDAATGGKGTLMKRAIKLMVPGNVSKRMSKVM